jgi:hypothetical protein
VLVLQGRCVPSRPATDGSGHDSAPESVCSRGGAVAGAQVAHSERRIMAPAERYSMKAVIRARGTLALRQGVGTRGRPVLFQPRNRRRMDTSIEPRPRSRSHEIPPDAGPEMPSAPPDRPWPDRPLCTLQLLATRGTAGVPNGGSRVLTITSDRDAALPMLRSVSSLPNRMSTKVVDISECRCTEDPVRRCNGWAAIAA